MQQVDIVIYLGVIKSCCWPKSLLKVTPQYLFSLIFQTLHCEVLTKSLEIYMAIYGTCIYSKYEGSQ